MKIDHKEMKMFENMHGVFVVDKEARVVYMGRDLLDEIALTEKDVLGKKINDIIPTTRVNKVLETGKEQLGVMYFVEGYTVIANGYPIYENGQLTGAIEVDIFSNVTQVDQFVREVISLPDIKPEVKKNMESNRGKYAKYSIDDIRGKSAKNIKLKEEINHASKSNSTLLITGETGSGKELVAHSVHKLGQRGLFNFVRLNCAAIPTELFESEMFGYEKGSFTGASKDGKIGKAEIANNGTLFLDEVDSLSFQEQGKLLRFLQEKEIYRIGGEHAIPINTRVITATNKDLNRLVKQNEFRNDLFYRLNVLEINVPPLRDRLEDIKEIVQGIVERLNIELDRSAYRITSIDERIYSFFMSYDWPGNIRELNNVVERAMSKSYSHELTLEHFTEISKSMEKDMASPYFTGNLENKTIRTVKEEAERRLITYNLHNPGL